MRLHLPRIVLFIAIFSFLPFFLAKNVEAGTFSSAKDFISDPRAGVSSTHTFQFTVPSSATINEIRFQFSTLPSGSAKPTGLVLNSTSIGTLVNLDAGWTINTSNAPSGLITLQHTNGGQNLVNSVVTIPLQSITNSGIADCDVETSSDSCFVQIQSATATGAWDTAVVDETTVMYTVVQAVTVSATVDPSFTFVISPVGINTVVGGVTTNVASTISTLPFGNLTAGTPKYSAHRLNVTTNSNSGYTVSMRMVSQMTGSYTSNNIDPYASPGTTWSTPKAWTEPTGSVPNTDTGWIGAYTSDSDVSQFDPTEFGPVELTNNTVMLSNGPDNGINPVYINYAIEVNVYQPADVYSGTLVYTATATY